MSLHLLSPMARRVALLVGLALLPLSPTTSSAQSPSATTASTIPGSTTEPFDINTATLEQLLTLPGIGPSKAAAIIEARTTRPFRRLRDLLRVRGIGRSTLDRLAPYLRFDPATAGQRSRAR